MVTRLRGTLILLLLPLALWAACDKVPLLAPTGTVITLIPVTTSGISLNSEVTIIATVIENGVAAAGSGGPSGGGGTKGAGTPVQNGTLITFTTTIGRIEPSEARTHNGQVSVRFITGTTSGTARITAYSGGASEFKDLAVGSAAVEAISVTTSPQALGASGGSVVVTATAVTAGGNPIGGVPITFSTTKGSVSPSVANTDQTGIATATLTTTTTADVTATSGAKTGKATVTVSAFALKSFTVAPTSTSAGVPVTFTVTPNDGVTVASVRVEFGDGGDTTLGSSNTAQTVLHVYRTPGFYTARATATDTGGGTSILTSQVVVGSLAVGISITDTNITVGESVLFQVTGIAETTPVDHFTWNFGDGSPEQDTTGRSISHQFTTPGQRIVRVDVFGVGSGKIGTATLQITVN